MPKAGPRDQVRREVLSYFVRFPEAADSIEGIARWRLLQERIHRTLAETREAIDWLVSQRYLVQIRTASTDPLFGLNSDKQADAVDYLTQTDSPVGDEYAR